VKAGATFVWGLKRSGIHFFVNWLYANHGATVEGPLEADGLHPQLHDGFADLAAGVAYYNNCGGLHSRGFSLGRLTPADFELARRRNSTSIFGIEDCRLEFVSNTPAGAGVARVLLLRDPLNNIASRLEGARTRPEVFRTDAAFVDLLTAYCEEFLGRTEELTGKTTVSYDRFVVDRAYRDSIASRLELPNVDAVTEVPAFGGGSSFSGGAERASAATLTTRFRQHLIPGDLLDRLIDRPAARDVCSTVFGYDLAELAAKARAPEGAAQPDG
jgi:hypothetical protein